MKFKKPGGIACRNCEDPVHLYGSRIRTLQTRPADGATQTMQGVFMGVMI